jgi:hypothetical protein
MRFPTILPFVFASIGLVRAEDFRELFTIPAGDDMATFEAEYVPSAASNSPM